jgi:hypothetical protein
MTSVPASAYQLKSHAAPACGSSDAIKTQPVLAPAMSPRADDSDANRARRLRGGGPRVSPVRHDEPVR